jgi:hypothetical protein
VPVNNDNVPDAADRVVPVDSTMAPDSDTEVAVASAVAIVTDPVVAVLLCPDDSRMGPPAWPPLLKPPTNTTAPPVSPMLVLSV